MKGKAPKNPHYPLFRLFAERGIGKDAFAEALGISRPYLDMILSGTRRPGSTLALKMSKLLGVPLEDILFPKVKGEAAKSEPKEEPKRQDRVEARA